MLLAPPRVAVRHRSTTAQTTASPLATTTAPSLPTLDQPRSSRLSPAAQGRLLAVLAFVVAAGGQVVAKAAYGMGAEPVSFLVIRLAAAVGLLVLLTRRQLFDIELRRRLTLLVVGVGFGAQTLAYFSALERAPVRLVVVVVSTYPMVVVTLDAMAERTMPSLRRIAVMGVSLIGLWLAAGSPTVMPDLGVLLALTSAVGYSIYLRASQRALTDVRPMVATAWVLTGALVTMLVIAIATTPAWPSVGGTGLAMLHGMVSTTVPIVAIYAALQRLRATEVAALGPLEPILATGVAAAVLGETLTRPELLGGVIVVAAIAQLSGIRPRFGLPRLPFAVPHRGRPLLDTRPSSTMVQVDRP